MRRSFVMLVPLVTLVAFPLARAQDANQPPPREFNIDVGFVSVSGNTDVTTLNLGEKLIRRLARWEFRQELGTVYGETDGVESSNQWRASLRADYGLGSRWALYALTAFDRNKFAGIRSRFEHGLGVVARLIATDRDQLNLESGFQLTQQKDLDNASNTFNSLRAAGSWKHLFSANAYFFQSAEFLPNLEESDDLRVNTETAVVAPLSSHVAMKFSYIVRFDNLPALNEAGTAPLRKTDRIFSSGIQVTF